MTARLPTAEAVGPAGTRRRGGFARVVRSGLAAWAIVVVLLLVLTVLEPVGLWSAANIASVLTGTAVLGLVSLGQYVVVLSGGIDLSVGSLATLSTLLTAVLIDGYPIRTLPVLCAMVVLGAVVGVGHGLLVGRAGLAPFVVTLATFYILQGVAFAISTSPTGQVTTALSAVALNRIGPIPMAFLVLAVAILVIAVLVNRTRFGRHVHAVGGDTHAARSNGVPVTRTIVLAYVAGGVLAALAGVLLAARATVGSPTAGQGLELSAITVVVVGGTSLLGGRGSLVGTLGGVVLLALVERSVVLLQLPSTLTDLIRGAVILAAAAIFVTGNTSKGRKR